VGVSHRRRREEDDMSIDQLEDLLIRLLRQEKSHPVPLKKLNLEVARHSESRRAGRIEAALARLVDAGEVLEIERESYFLSANLAAMERRICEILRAYHEAYPYEPEMATRDIKARFSKGKTRNVRRNVDPQLFDLALSALKTSARIVEGPEGVRLASFVPGAEGSPALRRFEAALIAYVDEHRYHVLDLAALARHLDADLHRTRGVFQRLLKNGELVHYGEQRYISARALQEVCGELAATFARAPRLRIAELKDALGIPRNAIIPLLEHLDRIGVTRRDGDQRRLAGRPDT
jgi:selenocysteine-specific elongation factor